eukprot:13679428-Alexandrium_andersonii.AAC.1
MGHRPDFASLVGVYRYGARSRPRPPSELDAAPPPRAQCVFGFGRPRAVVHALPESTPVFTALFSE